MRPSRGGRPRMRWALPTQPPETWLGPLWPLGVAVAVAVAVLVPLQIAPESTPLAPTTTGVLLALGGAGAVLAAYGLVVQALVTDQPRLRWVGAGFAGLAVALLVQVVGLRRGDHVLAEASSVAGHLSLSLSVLSSALVRRGPLLVAVPLGLAAATGAGLVAAGAHGHGAQAVASAAAWAAAVVWLLPRPRPHGVGARCVALALVLDAGAAAWSVTETTHDALRDTAPAAVAVALPGALLAWFAVRRYHRQARRWERMELAARGLRSRTALLPDRSITPDDDEGLPERAAVQHLLAGGVGLALQPVRDLRDGRVLGQEALARFGGREPTDRWFRAAAAHGLGAELERRTLACALEHRPAPEPGAFLALNVSPLALADEQVRGLLLSQELSDVLVEITEHDAVSDYASLRASLRALREQGARIAVDDTGAGFASLRHVLLLQPDVVKLDIALTRDAGDPRQVALVRAVVAFAREVGCQVLAEGIETDEQQRALMALGVRLGQGWHLGVPEVVVQPAPAGRG